MWPAHESVSISENILREWIKSYENRDFYQWAITFKESSSEPIGKIGVVRQDDTMEWIILVIA